EALGIATLGSALGGLISALLLIFLAEKIAFVALEFSAQEYFAVAAFGLSIIVSLSHDFLKGIIAGLFGIMVGFIGLDGVTGVQRYTFGSVRMMSGINLIPVIIGLFAVAELLRLVESGAKESKVDVKKINRVLPPVPVLVRLIPTFIRSAIIGTLVGILPGAGANMAAFVSYDTAKRVSKTPEKFGTGLEEGVAACETANNAVTGGAMIPMLTLGIPGDAVTAVLLSALMVQGFAPGPLLFSQHMDIVYPIFAAMILANVFVMLQGLILARPVAKIAMIPQKYLIPGIAIFAMIGSFASSGYLWDLYVALIFGVLGYFLSKMDFEIMPIVLGLLLGGMIERYYRQAMVLAKGDWTQFFTRPISCVLLVIAIGTLLINGYKEVKHNWLGAPKKTEEAKAE
ncbi:MAG: tripartite tricarboxylate transporter permease, partial [Lachnospiraceae bacterium]|nr:tripartite tricarboxylate transporter permease [Lachnospiraceae bacterium]